MNWKSIIIILLSALTLNGCAEAPPPPPKHKYHAKHKRHMEGVRPEPTPIEKIVIIQQTPPLAYTPTPAPISVPVPTATPQRRGEF